VLRQVVRFNTNKKAPSTTFFHGPKAQRGVSNIIPGPLARRVVQIWGGGGGQRTYEASSGGKSASTAKLGLKYKKMGTGERLLKTCEKISKNLPTRPGDLKKRAYIKRTAGACLRRGRSISTKNKKQRGMINTKTGKNLGTEPEGFQSTKKTKKSNDKTRQNIRGASTKTQDPIRRKKNSPPRHTPKGKMTPRPRLNGEKKNVATT